MPPRGRPFKPGEGGRPVGAINRTTRAIRELAATILTDERGRAKLLELYRQGRLPAPIFITLCHYAAGKPPSTLRLEGEERRPLVIDLVRDPEAWRREMAEAETDDQLDDEEAEDGAAC